MAGKTIDCARRRRQYLLILLPSGAIGLERPAVIIGRKAILIGLFNGFLLARRLTRHSVRNRLYAASVVSFLRALYILRELLEAISRSVDSRRSHLADEPARGGRRAVKTF